MLLLLFFLLLILVVVHSLCAEKVESVAERQAQSLTGHCIEDFMGEMMSGLLKIRTSK